MIATPETKKTVCPICKTPQITAYKITEADGEMIEWFHCFCGVIFHENGVNKTDFNAEYAFKWADMKGVKDRTLYAFKTYLPIIEEAIYGRKFLDVGFTVPHMIEDLKSRGWVATGIDLIKNDYIVGDFEEFDFEGHTFDFIHLGHVLESFENPIAAIAKCYDMLNKDGILMLTHPAPELIHHVGLQRFGAWDHKHAWIFLSEPILKRTALGFGFDVLLNRLNYSQRFVVYHDRHMLLQKKF